MLPGKAADKAGIKPGDIIRDINKQEVINGKAALNAIAQNKPGTKVEVGLLRNGKKITVAATVTQRPIPKQWLVIGDKRKIEMSSYLGGSINICPSFLPARNFSTSSSQEIYIKENIQIQFSMCNNCCNAST